MEPLERVMQLNGVYFSGAMPDRHSEAATINHLQRSSDQLPINTQEGEPSYHLFLSRIISACCAVVDLIKGDIICECGAIDLIKGDNIYECDAIDLIKVDIICECGAIDLIKVDIICECGAVVDLIKGDIICEYGAVVDLIKGDIHGWQQERP